MKKSYEPYISGATIAIVLNIIGFDIADWQFYFALIILSTVTSLPYHDKH